MDWPRDSVDAGEALPGRNSKSDTAMGTKNDFRYEGILAEPFPFLVPSLADGVIVDPRWEPTLRSAYSQQYDLYNAKKNALLRSFQIDPRSPETFMVLSFELILRHERKLPSSHSTGQIAELFKEFDVSPEDPERWQGLALELCNRHVPGFEVRKPNLVFSTPDLLRVFVAVVRISEGRKRISNRELARVLRNKRALARIVGRQAASLVHEALQKPAKKRNYASNIASDRWLRGLLREIRCAARDFAQGGPTDLQLQLLFQVWPLLLQLGQTES